MSNCQLIWTSFHCPPRARIVHWVIIAASCGLISTMERPAVAIDIQLIYTTEGDEPAWDPNGDILMAHAHAAEAIWERLLPGSSNTYELWIEWDVDVPPGVKAQWNPFNGDPTFNTIEFQPDASISWFTDPTPDDHAEFSFSNFTPSASFPLGRGTTLYRDLGERQTTIFPGAAPPNVLEVGFRGQALDATCPGSITSSFCAGPSGIPSTTGEDLLSTMLHEMGHELGVNVEDGDYDIHPLHVGVVADVLVLKDSDSNHLAGNGKPPFLMCDGCGPPGVRRLPTATDVLVIAENEGLSDVHLDRADFIGGSWENPFSWIGGRVPDETVAAFVRDGPGSCSVGLFASDAIAASIHISTGCQFFTHNRALAAFNAPSTITAFPGEPDAELIVSGGGWAVLGDLTLDSGHLELSTGGVAVINGAIRINRNQGVVGRIFNNAGDGRVDVVSLLSNNGLIRSQSGTLAIGPPVAGGLPSLDLDGAPDSSGVEPGEIDALHGSIRLNGTMADDFDGAMQIGAADRVTFDENWALGARGHIELRGGSAAAAEIDGSSTATIGGFVNVSRLGRFASTATVMNPSADVEIGGRLDRLELAGLTTFRGGRYSGGGTLAQIGLALIEQSTTISVDTYDWDGDDAAPSLTSILPGARFQIDSPRINPTANDYHGKLHSLGGTLDMSMRYRNPLTPPPVWSLATDGEMHLKNETSLSQTGEPPGRGAVVTGVPVDVSGLITALGAANRIDADVYFRHSARVQLLTASSELILNGRTEYRSGSYTGPGALIQNGDADVYPNLIGQFPPQTIIDVATYDWDGRLASPSSTHIHPGATLFIRSQRIEESGNGYDGSLTVDAGTMMVRLGGATSWQLNSGAAIRLQDGAILSAAADVSDPRQTGGTSLGVSGRLTAAGTVANDIYTTVAFNSTAQVIVEPGATLNLRGSQTTYVGGSHTGNGTLRQWKPATVKLPTTLAVATVDLDGGDENTVWSIDADLTLNANQIDVGNNVFNGVLDANKNATLAVHLPPPASWQIAGTLSVGATVPPTTLQVAGSPVQLSGGVAVKGSGTLIFRNDVSGAASFTNGGTVKFLGQYSPGSNLAIVNFANDLEFGPDSRLKIEMRGLTPGTRHDQLVVTQDVVFDGTLEIDLLGTYTPVLGNEFVLATYASHTGQFAATDLPLLSPPGTYWALAYRSTSLVATIATTIAGDLSLDGVVDVHDAALFAGFFGLSSGSTWATGDFNGDGATTLADLALLQANMGISTSSPVASSPVASTSAVPEPNTWVLLASTMSLLALRGRGFSRTINRKGALS